MCRTCSGFAVDLRAIRPGKTGEQKQPGKLGRSIKKPPAFRPGDSCRLWTPLRAAPTWGAGRATPDKSNTADRDCQGPPDKKARSGSRPDRQSGPPEGSLDARRTMGERRTDNGKHLQITGGGWARAQRTGSRRGREPPGRRPRAPREPPEGAAGAGGRPGGKLPTSTAAARLGAATRKPKQRGRIRTASPRRRGRAEKKPRGPGPKKAGASPQGPRGRSRPPPKPPGRRRPSEDRSNCTGPQRVDNGARSGLAQGGPGGATRSAAASPRRSKADPPRGRPQRSEGEPKRSGASERRRSRAAAHKAERKSRGAGPEGRARRAKRGRRAPDRAAKRRRARRAGADPRRGRGPGARGDAECAKSGPEARRRALPQRVWGRCLQGPRWPGWGPCGPGSRATAPR